LLDGSDFGRLKKFRFSPTKARGASLHKDVGLAEIDRLIQYDVLENLLNRWAEGIDLIIMKSLGLSFGIFSFF